MTDDKVGVPKGVYNLANGDGAGVGNPLSEHPKIHVRCHSQDQALLVLKLWKKPLKIFKKVSVRTWWQNHHI
ncbi:hypothetical protein ACVPOR_10235 [Staphylococcus aureus]